MKTNPIFLQIISALLLLAVGNAKSQEIICPTLHLRSGDTNDSFGSAVAMDGDVAVIGAFRAEDEEYPFAEYGSVFVLSPFSLSNLNAELFTLKPSDPSWGKWFGHSVAVSGDTIVVGAPGSGAVYLFERDQAQPRNWVQTKKLTGNTLVGAGTFGWSVAIQGDVIVVGAPANAGYSSIYPDKEGAVYIYQRNAGGAGQWGQVNELKGDYRGASDHFGWALALDNDYLVIGARNDSVSRAHGGAAYVFQHTEGVSWSRRAKLTGWVNHLFFGSSVAISGHTIVVGDRWAGPLVFELAPDSVHWSLVKSLLPAGISSLQNSTVAIDGDQILVGAPYSASSDTEFFVYQFDRNYDASNPDQPLPNAWGHRKTLSPCTLLTSFEIFPV